jgi:hypothetical protein
MAEEAEKGLRDAVSRASVFSETAIYWSLVLAAIAIVVVVMKGLLG